MVNVEVCAHMWSVCIPDCVSVVKANQHQTVTVGARTDLVNGRRLVRFADGTCGALIKMWQGRVRG